MLSAISGIDAKIVLVSYEEGFDNVKVLLYNQTSKPLKNLLDKPNPFQDDTIIASYEWEEGSPKAKPTIL